MFLICCFGKQPHRQITFQKGCSCISLPNPKEQAQTCDRRFGEPVSKLDCQTRWPTSGRLGLSTSWRSRKADVGFYDELHAAAEGCDFLGLGPHSFRRANITWRQEVGASSIEASKLLAMHACG
jgi:hypothetical protein